MHFRASVMSLRLMFSIYEVFIICFAYQRIRSEFCASTKPGVLPGLLEHMSLLIQKGKKPFWTPLFLNKNNIYIFRNASKQIRRARGMVSCIESICILLFCF